MRVTGEKPKYREKNLPMPINDCFKKRRSQKIQTIIMPIKYMNIRTYI